MKFRPSPSATLFPYTTLFRSTRDSPVPFLEQISQRVAEARQEMFAFQESSGADQLALRARMADFNRFSVGGDDPGDLRAAGEKVPEPVVDLSAGVVGRKDFDG